MSKTRTLLSVALLWLVVAAPALAIEVLPMDSVEPECEGQASGQAAIETAAPELDPIEDTAEAPAGLQAAGSPQRAHTPAPSGGGDAAVPQAPKAGSRWNAFLPGMVR